MSKLITKNDLKAIFDTILPKYVNDTGWITLTPTSQFTAYTSGGSDAPRYRKINNIVNVCGVLRPTSTIAAANMSSEYTIFTLPEGVRPPIDLVTIHQGSANAIWMSRVRADGVVTFSRHRDMGSASGGYTQVTTNHWLPFNITFMTSNTN